MNLKAILTAIGLSALPIVTHSAPYCDSLLDRDRLPGSYKKLAPIHSSSETGWIFTNRMLEENYEMKPEAFGLTKKIIEHFDARNIPLSIVVAPPRTVIAGQDIVNATTGGNLHDVQAARSSFDALVEQLNKAGAIAPNLAEIATSAEDLREAFYFKRDTHWTALGAAASAEALANKLGLDHNLETTTANAEEDERGSLADVVRKVCRLDLPPESFPLVEFPEREGDLFNNGTAPIALLGTSFSNRYKKDFYRVGDAFSAALRKDVENLSQAGTGMIGIIEGFVLSGRLGAKPELVIWETPYTESFNSTSNLRQLLGALEYETIKTTTPVQIGELNQTVDVSDNIDLAVLQIGTNEPVRGTIEVTLENGSTKTIKFNRRDRVPANLRSEMIAVSLTDLGAKVVSVSVNLKSESTNNSKLELYGTAEQNG